MFREWLGMTGGEKFVLKLLLEVPFWPSIDIDAAASKSGVESSPLPPEKLKAPFVAVKGSCGDWPKEVVEPSNVGGNSSQSKLKEPGALSGTLKKSLLSN